MPMHQGWMRMLRVTVLATCLALPACSRPPPPPASPANQVASMQVTEIVEGTGATAMPGMRVTVHYTGWLYDSAAAGQKGTQFDSSRDKNRPFTFELGAGKVITGWDQGVAGMKVGGQRRLVIPADLAYGSRGAGGVIPPAASLVFDVELLAVQP
jgi:FKBP-type peptidyl-prolyl cis-trans isomerase FkpA